MTGGGGDCHLFDTNRSEVSIEGVALSAGGGHLLEASLIACAFTSSAIVRCFNDEGDWVLESEVPQTSGTKKIAVIGESWCLLWGIDEYQCGFERVQDLENFNADVTSELPSKLRDIAASYHSIYGVDGEGNLLLLGTRCAEAYLGIAIEACQSSGGMRIEITQSVIDGVEFIDVQTAFFGVHACARNAELELYCWGAPNIAQSAAFGILPLPQPVQTIAWLPPETTFVGRGSNPVKMPFGEKILDYAVGADTICVIGEVSGPDVHRRPRQRAPGSPVRPTGDQLWREVVTRPQLRLTANPHPDAAGQTCFGVHSKRRWREVEYAGRRPTCCGLQRAVATA